MGSGVEKPAALKALLTWVDLGVLAEEGAQFRLLETAEEPSGPAVARAVTVSEEESQVTSVQQQQAAQMQVYWKASALFADALLKLTTVAVHRRHAHESGSASYRPYPELPQVCGRVRSHA